MREYDLLHLSTGAHCSAMGGVASRDNFEQILKRLSGEDVDPGDHQFWDEMWKTTLAAEVAQSSLSPLGL
jgi:hypothetical protein